MSFGSFMVRRTVYIKRHVSLVIFQQMNERLLEEFRTQFFISRNCGPIFCFSKYDKPYYQYDVMFGQPFPFFQSISIPSDPLMSSN